MHRPGLQPNRPACWSAATCGGEVRFAELSPLAVYLLSSIGEQPGLEGQAHLRQLARAHGLAEDALAEPGAALLQQFVQAGVIGPLASPP